MLGAELKEDTGIDCHPCGNPYINVGCIHKYPGLITPIVCAKETAATYKLFSDLNGVFMFSDEDKPHEDVEGECLMLCFNVPHVWNIRDAVIPCDKRIAVFQLQEATKSLLKDDIDWEARLGCLYAAGQSS